MEYQWQRLLTSQRQMAHLTVNQYLHEVFAIYYLILTSDLCRYILRVGCSCQDQYLLKYHFFVLRLYQFVYII